MIRLNPQLRASYCALCFLLPSLSLAASTNAGQVLGKILDPRGVAVAGAHLKLLNSAGEVIREVKSDDQGSFILDGVEPGEYQLRAEEPTFVSVILGVSVARGHQEQAKPLGDGFTGVPVREIRGAILRPFFGILFGKVPNVAGYRTSSMLTKSGVY